MGLKAITASTILSRMIPTVVIMMDAMNAVLTTMISNKIDITIFSRLSGVNELHFSPRLWSGTIS